MNDSLHPASVRLELFAAGDQDPKVAEHLAACESCKKLVTELESGAAHFAANEADAFIAMVSATSNTNTTSTPNTNSTSTPTSNATPTSTSNATPTSTSTPKTGSVTFLRVARVVTPILALAAGFIFLARWSPSVDDVPPNSSSFDEPHRFKGGIQAAVVRDRAGVQDRLVTDIAIRPNDRARIEVSLDRSQPITAGILENDGTWTVLLAPALLDGGTHYSEQAARFDERPTNGWAIIGEPGAVERARATRNFDGVVALPLHAEAP